MSQKYVEIYSNENEREREKGAHRKNISVTVLQWRFIH